MKRLGVVHRALCPALNIPLDPCRDGAICHVRLEAFEVQTESLGVPPNVGRLEAQLVADEDIVQFPEPTLPSRCLCRFGRRLSVRVNLAERKVPEHDLEGVTALEPTTEVAHRPGGVPAFEVTVDDQLAPAIHATGVVSCVDWG